MPAWKVYSYSGYGGILEWREDGHLYVSTAKSEAQVSFVHYFLYIQLYYNFIL